MSFAPTSYDVTGVKLTTGAAGYEEVDAVELQGWAGPAPDAEVAALEEAFWDADPLAMVSGLGMPVGFAFSAGWSLIPAWNVTAAITKSTILYSSSQCCP